MKRTDLKRNAFNAVSIVLIVAMVIWAIAFVMHVQAYNQMVAELTNEDVDRPELKKAYIHFKSIAEWRNGSILLGTGILLVVVGVTLIGIKLSSGMNKKPNKGLVLALIALISLALLLQMSPSVAIEPSQTPLTEPFITVRMLCAGDEEFMSNDNNIADVEAAIEKANNFGDECFKTTFGVHFDPVAWLTWDSRDDVNMPKAMAKEVWDETGYDAGNVYNNQYVAMLLAVTGQDIVGYWGCAFPDANITLLETSCARDFLGVRHELSHMLQCEDHGDTPCIMNQNWMRPWWCDSCNDFIHNHKYWFTIVADVNGDYKVNLSDIVIITRIHGSVRGDELYFPSCDVNGNDEIDDFDLFTAYSNRDRQRFPKQFTLSIASTPGGYVDATPSCSKYDEGTHVELTPKLFYDYYYFDYWVIDGEQKEENPLHVVMDMDHAVKAYFVATKTRYHRSDTWTVNTITTYKFLPYQTGSMRVVESSASGSKTIYWGIRVFKVDDGGNLTEITAGTPVAVVSRAVDGEGIQSNTWDCPLTSMVSTDAIHIRVYIKDGTRMWGNPIAMRMISQQLGAESLDAATWTVYYYTKRLYIPAKSTTYGDYFWGSGLTGAYASRVANFTWTPAAP